jgi:putative two-component system response regulator
MEPTIPITSKQILVVEDNEDTRKAIVQILQIENYHVLQASEEKEALTILTTIKPDLILSDINIPNKSGLELFHQVRNNLSLSAIPFVFLMSSSQKESIHTIRELGVEGWVQKPINPLELTRTINTRLLRAAEVKIAHINQAYIETVEVLVNAVEGRDHYTRGHTDRVTTYSLWTVEELRWPPENIRILEFGARLHDIGKIIVPDQILNKPEKLTTKEWDLMKEHPVAGAKMLRKISHLKEAIPYILYHHEKWNGKGYPEGLQGREIPLGARVLAIADVFDALTTARPYRPGIPRDVVFQFLEQESGNHFDPDLVATFIQVIINRSAMDRENSKMTV